MKEEALPDWKLKAIKKGVMKDPRIEDSCVPLSKDPAEEKNAFGRRGRKKMAARRPKQTVNIYQEDLPALVQLGFLLGTGRSYADIITRLVHDRMAEFGDVMELVNRRR